jgi:hypothetical protein
VSGSITIVLGAFLTLFVAAPMAVAARQASPSLPLPVEGSQTPKAGAVFGRCDRLERPTYQ